MEPLAGVQRGLGREGERKMKRQTLMHALGLLRQRAGHKALMDVRLKIHLISNSTDVSAARPVLYNRCHNLRKMNGTDVEKRGSVVCFM